ncbi:hypothetical protein BV22DRAFT_1122289 [Leucogyrophana mollusca]|uniref:Uncharacterized protein n=1 Tax=Leucogyrophana mollusca TaxID=85980 RepID=A0ACB8B6B4_9AGAM|nr:hypothetical protein BV22DRAFT_1122289 [Leucogyrophana mollusca]
MTPQVLQFSHIVASDVDISSRHDPLSLMIKVGKASKKTGLARGSNHTVHWDDALSFDLSGSTTLEMSIMHGGDSIWKTARYTTDDVFLDGTTGPIRLDLFDAKGQAGISIGKIEFSVCAYWPITSEQELTSAFAASRNTPTVAPLVLRISKIKFSPNADVHKSQYQIRLTIGGRSILITVARSPGTESESDEAFHFGVHLLAHTYIEAEIIHHHAFPGLHDTILGRTQQKLVDDLFLINPIPSPTLSLHVYSENSRSAIGKVEFCFDRYSLAESRLVEKESRSSVRTTHPNRTHFGLPVTMQHQQLQQSLEPTYITFPTTSHTLKLSKIKVDNIPDSMGHRFYVQAKVGAVTMKTAAAAADSKHEIRWNDALDLPLHQSRNIHFQLFERSLPHLGGKCIKTTREVTIDDLLEDKSSGLVRCKQPLYGYGATLGQGIEMGEIEFCIN